MIKYFRYNHLNCYFVENSKKDIMAFDAGWPCTLFEYKKLLKTIELDYNQIKWCIVSHIHMDHAGLIGEFQLSGIDCYMTNEQMSNICEMERIISGNKEYRNYEAIKKNLLKIMTTGEINTELNKNGLHGKILKTTGHSDDSISFLTDAMEALIGDLSPIEQVMAGDEKSNNSWLLLLEAGASLIYPSHADIFRI